MQDLERSGTEPKTARFFLWASLAALGLRLLLVWRFPGVVDDSRLYADIARNWLHHGAYGITNSGAIMPTLSRLPGYPAFLAAIFAVFGDDNYRAVLLVQVLFDLATCFLIADMARRLLSERAAKAAFLLAALCPFLANYAAAALTETLEIFFTVLALDLVLRGLGVGESPPTSPLLWLGCGFSVGAAILLRPDGGILLGAVGGYLVWLLFRSLRPEKVSTSPGNRLTSRTVILAGVLVATGALAPLIPWTLRNLHTLHRFQPLAPRYATDSDEPVMTGFNRWVKTWMADYVSVQELYWPVPGSDIDITRLPNRAFDSLDQRNRTSQLFSDYNGSHDMSPELDARFAALAAERIQAAPLRYYVGLPALRIADMWLRPRTELFPSDPRWWEFNDDARWLTVSLAFGLINLAYVATGAAGLIRSRKFFGIGLCVLFLALRSLFLGTLENPEPRYTLECYPVVIILAAACFHRSA
ncbi:MAG TPA: glycosyltransferase family 39 protein [Candidatus Dormibacteraeota bacterium]|nr:glycosyltransferase family 39 protein [Candidatus Dormibacteraeota bacterium]